MDALAATLQSSKIASDPLPIPVTAAFLKYADAMLCPDDEDFLDREQGIPHLKGIPCRINKLDAPPEGAK